MFMMRNKTSKLLALVSTFALVFGGAVLPTQSALATASTDAQWHTLVGNNWKTTICHRTHATTNPYRKITVSDSAVYGSSGHSNPNHDRDYTVNGVTYHVYTPTVSYPSNQKFWGDIIPPQNASRRSGNPSTVETSGMNWITEGIAIYDGVVGGCRTMTDREFIASELEGGETFQNIAQDLNDQDPDGPRWTANQVQTTAASITTAAAGLTLVNDSKTTPVNTPVTDSAATLFLSAKQAAQHVIDMAAWQADQAAHAAAVHAARELFDTVTMHAYQRDLAAFEARLEQARQEVDRISYTGKAPCNVLGAAPGAYIVAVDDGQGGIAGIPVVNPSFEQYRLAVGRVNRILPDGRAEVAVIVH